MKTTALLLLCALLATAPFEAAEAATPAAAVALPTLKADLPLFGKASVEKRKTAKRKQTLRRRKRMFSF